MENSPRSAEEDQKEADYQRRVAPEANQLHGKDLPPEEIGHVLMAGETAESGRSNEARIPSENTSRELIDWQRVATMGRGELLRISEKITVDATTLRHAYETHLIGENGLRRLVYEHMQGGNLHEALRNEIMEHQTDFERDPQLRHQPDMPDSLKHSGMPGAAGSNLENLLARSGLAKLDPDKELTAPKALPEHGVGTPRLKPKQRRLLDVALVTIILILVGLVVLLAMTRR